MAWYKASSGGTHKYDSGTVTVSSSETVKVTLGYKPTFIYILFKKNNNRLILNYSEDNYPNYQIVASHTSSDSFVESNVPTTASNRIISIDNDGFTLGTWQGGTISSYGSTANWIAGK